MRGHIKCRKVQKKQKQTRFLPLCHWINESWQRKFHWATKTFLPRTFRFLKELFCGWTDRKNCFTHHWKLKFRVRVGMKVKKTNKILKFYQKKLLQIYSDLNTLLKCRAVKNISRRYLWKYEYYLFRKVWRRRKNKRKVCSCNNGERI